MTKKDLTALLIAFAGTWLIIQGALTLLTPIYTLIFSAMMPAGSHGAGFISAVASLSYAVFYGLAGAILIRKSNKLAEKMLSVAHIESDIRIPEFEFSGALQIFISLLGLYLFSTHIPQFLITLVKWFSVEAQGPEGASLLGGANQYIDKYKSSMIYDGLVSAFSMFVFLRSHYLANLVEKFKK